MKSLRLVFLFTLSFMLLATVSVFAQEVLPSVSPTLTGSVPVSTTEAPVPIVTITTAALAVTGVVASLFMTFLKGRLNLSGTTSFFVYVGISAAIAVGVTLYFGAFNSKDFGATFAILFAVGQAVYQSFVKNTQFETKLEG